MGFFDSLGSVLFGGLGRSTNPADYSVANPQQANINYQMGMGQAQVDPTQQAAFRQMQLQQAQQLQNIASGQAQGAGELAVQRQVAAAQAAQQAAARMARGGQNAALAMRNAANQQAQIGLGGAGQAQQAALSDQQAAQGQLAGVLGQGRGQDIGLAGQNAQLQQQRYGEDLGALTSLNGQQLGAQTGSMQAALGQQGIAGGLLNTAGTLLAKSDRSLKTDINEDAGPEIDDMLDNLVAKTYRYKDPRNGEGERAGIMAQDLAKSKAGSALVVKLPNEDALGFDVTKAVSAALASTARLNARLRKVEDRG